MSAPLLVLIVAGCAAVTSVCGQPPPPPAAPKPAVAAPPSPIEQTNYDSSKDPLANPPPDSMSVIRARVNNMPILDEDVRAAAFHDLHNPRLYELPDQERMEVIRQILAHALQELIDRELVISEMHRLFAKRKPQYVKSVTDGARKEFDKHISQIKKNMEKAGMTIKSDKEIKDFFQSQGTSFETYRRHFERNYIMMEFLRALIYPSIKAGVGHKEIKDYYDQHASEFESTDNLTWLDVFVDAGRFKTREEAKRVADQVQARAVRGEDFLELVKKFDQGDSSWRQGEGAGHRTGEIRPVELEGMLFKMKPREVGPVVEVSNGYHIVKVSKREYTGRKPFSEEVQTEIRHKLTGELANREQRRVLVELRRKASIEVISDSGR
jgi:hypothetical protein